MLNFCDFIQVYVFTTNHHLKGFLLKVSKKLTLPATAVWFFTSTSNLHKVTSFSDVTAVKTQRHLTM